MDFNAITYYPGKGVQVTSGAASANTTIPNTADGNRARFVALICPSGYVYATACVGIGVSATAADIPIVSTQPPVILSVKQFDHIAYLQGSAAALLNILPVEF